MANDALKADLFPPRLKETRSPEALEQRSAALLRAVPARPAFSSAALKRVADRLDERFAPRASFTRRMAFALAALGVGVPLAATAAFVAWPAWSAAPKQTIAAPTPIPSMLHRHHGQRADALPSLDSPPPAIAPPAAIKPPPPQAAAMVPAPAAVPPTPVPSPSVAASAVAAPNATAAAPAVARPQVVPARAAPVALPPSPVPTAALPSATLATAPAPTPSALAEQAAWLQRAIHQLRRERDPAAAVRSLAAFEAAFPRSPMLADARAAQVEADLALAREEDALLVLDRFAANGFAGAPRAEGLRALRGELLARDGRCLEAIADFAPILASADPAVRERALYGDATCQARRGDAEAGRAALTRYLREFPQGPHAAQAAAALGGRP